KAAVSSAQRRFPEYRLSVGDVSEPLDLPQGTMDLCVAIDVLYHIVDDLRWEQALRNLCRLLGAGGRCTLTPESSRLSSERLPPHVSRRSRWAYEDVLAAEGMERVGIRRVFVFMDDPLVLAEPRWLAGVSYWQWRVVQKAIRLLGRAPPVRDAVALSLAALQY